MEGWEAIEEAQGSLAGITSGMQDCLHHQQHAKPARKARYEEQCLRHQSSLSSEILAMSKLVNVSHQTAWALTQIGACVTCFQWRGCTMTEYLDLALHACSRLRRRLARARRRRSLTPTC